ncbi:unnamed protein product, partial [Heterotrigona itama]
MRPDCSINVGWTQEWTSLKRLRRNKYIDVREVVRGPFSSPRLLKTQPFVAFSSCQQRENYFDLPRGIPDTWREYLISKGFCTASEAYVLQKNLIPSCIRYLATDRLWNDTSLSFIQGIPDPWKSRQPTKYSRPRFPRAKDIPSTRIAYTYDGDDEAEIERSERCQFNKDRIDDKKDPPREGHRESNYPLIEETFKDNVEARKTAERYSNRLPFDKESEISSRNKRRGNAKHNQYTEIDLENVRKITSNKSIRKDLKSKTITKKGVQTVPTNVADEATQTGILLKDKITQEDGPFSKKHVQINTQPYTDDTVCCNCMLRGHILSNMHCFPNFANLWKDVDLSNRVLCQECENIYCRRESEKLIIPTKKLEFCTPGPKKYSKRSQRVCMTQKEIYKRTKQKLRVCMQNARKRLAVRDRPDDCMQTKDAIVSKQELKLMCYHCNSPYLKIASISANTSGRDARPCICRTASSKLKTVQHKIGDHVTKHSIRKRRKNCTCCSESKRYISKCGLDCTSSPSVVIKWKNNVLAGKIHSGFSKGNNHDDTMHGNVVTADIKGMVKDASGNQLFADGIREERCEKEPEEGDYSCNVVNKNKEMDKQANTAINANEEKIEAAQFQHSKSDKTLWYSVSDSGECADLSDNIADAGFNVTAQDRFSVTSITSTQQLDNAISTKRHYQKKRSRRPCHARCKSSGGIASDFKQNLEFGSNFPIVTSCNNVPCSSTKRTRS